MIDINTKIMIGGIKQRIHIKTDDASKPVLLFLHGGPGVCNRHNIMTAHLDLLDTFTIEVTMTQVVLRIVEPSFGCQLPIPHGFREIGGDIVAIVVNQP